MKLYDVGNRDVEKLGQLYCDHVSAMTGEKLHSKADIAAELAWRDQKLQAAEEEIADYADKLNLANAHITAAEERIAFFRNGIDNQIEMKNKAIAQRNELKEEITQLREALRLIKDQIIGLV